MAGDGIISTNSLSNSVWNNNTTGAYTFEAGCIRGANLSDIFVSGWGSNVIPDVAHYNGSTWFDYINQMPGGYGTYPRNSVENPPFFQELKKQEGSNNCLKI